MTKRSRCEYEVSFTSDVERFFSCAKHRRIDTEDDPGYADALLEFRLDKSNIAIYREPSLPRWIQEILDDSGRYSTTLHAHMHKLSRRAVLEHKEFGSYIKELCAHITGQDRLCILLYGLCFCACEQAKEDINSLVTAIESLFGHYINLGHRTVDILNRFNILAPSEQRTDKVYIFLGLMYTRFSQKEKQDAINEIFADTRDKSLVYLCCMLKCIYSDIVPMAEHLIGVCSGGQLFGFLLDNMNRKLPYFGKKILRKIFYSFCRIDQLECIGKIICSETKAKKSNVRALLKREDIQFVLNDAMKSMFQLEPHEINIEVLDSAIETVYGEEWHDDVYRAFIKSPKWHFYLNKHGWHCKSIMKHATRDEIREIFQKIETLDLVHAIEILECAEVHDFVWYLNLIEASVVASTTEIDCAELDQIIGEMVTKCMPSVAIIKRFVDLITTKDPYMADVYFTHDVWLAPHPYQIQVCESKTDLIKALAEFSRLSPNLAFEYCKAICEIEFGKLSYDMVDDILKERILEAVIFALEYNEKCAAALYQTVDDKNERSTVAIKTPIYHKILERARRNGYADMSRCLFDKYGMTLFRGCTRYTNYIDISIKTYD